MDIASNACDQQDIPVKQGTSLPFPYFLAV